MRVLIVSMGYMATCSDIPAIAPASICCGTASSQQLTEKTVEGSNYQTQGLHESYRDKTEATILRFVHIA